MKRRNLISAIALVALTVMSFLETSNLPIGDLSAPQPGFFPLILSILLGIFSLAFLIQSIFTRVNDGLKVPFWESSDGKKGLILTLVAVFVFAFLFERLGYLICVFLLIAFLLKTIGNRPWWMVITISLLSTLVCYLLFTVMLKAQLPTGILGI